VTDRDQCGNHRKVVLLGHLNVGKTTLFHRLCGDTSTIAPHSDSGIDVGRGTITVAGTRFEIIDAPGFNSAAPDSEDERITREILLLERPDLAVIVIDGRMLRRSLILIIQIVEHGFPVVVVVNRIDESRQRGIRIDIKRLGHLLGVPVVWTIALEGVGDEWVRKSLLEARQSALSIVYPPAIESRLTSIAQLINGTGLDCRAVKVGLLASHEQTRQIVAARSDRGVVESVDAIVRIAQSSFGRPLATVVLESRFAVADRVVAQVQSVDDPVEPSLTRRISVWLREPLTAYPIAALVIVVTYLFVGWFGAGKLVDLIEGRLFGQTLIPAVERMASLVPHPWFKEVLVGQFGLVSVGLDLAFGVVLPVMIVFFTAFGFLEDSGYLARLSVLFDRPFRHVGLNGKGVVPLSMGFSCTTVAIMTTRVLETQRERFIATLLLVSGIPCAPVMAVMLVLLARMSIWASTVVFGLLGCQVILIGFLVNKLLPGGRSDFILELPPVRLPRIRELLEKTMWRSWWFATEAIPLFLLATFVLFLLDKAGFLTLFENTGRPVLTGLLGLPPRSVEVMIMALIRKESGAAMIKQFHDTGLLDNVQVVVLVLLLAFMFPCVNAIIVMLKERGIKQSATIVVFVMGYAVAVGSLVNLACRTFSVTFR